MRSGVDHGRSALGSQFRTSMDRTASASYTVYARSAGCASSVPGSVDGKWSLTIYHVLLGPQHCAVGMVCNQEDVVDTSYHLAFTLYALLRSYSSLHSILSMKVTV